MIIKKLIVGINSRLVHKIKDRLLGFDFISHTELCNTNFSKYEYIFLFSWNHKSVDDFKKNIELIPPGKLVFVSTTAVFSLQKRNQWNAYPVCKSIAESWVINKSSTVLRIGITDPDSYKFFTDAYPYTSYELLSSLLNNWNVKSGVVNAFAIELGKANPILGLLSKALYKASSLLPNNLYAQIVPQGISKILLFRDYGYTSDANKYFYEEIQIGYGALGAAYDKLNFNKAKAIFVSNSQNVELNENGFFGTLVGLDGIGLARLWHGVSMKSCSTDGNTLKKSVPFFVKRFRPRKNNLVNAHISCISHTGSCWQLKTDNGISYFTNKLILAAGPFENIKLLSCIDPLDCKFSDHEIFFSGTTNRSDAVRIGGIKEKGFLFVRGNSFKRIANGVEFIFDFRPFTNTSDDRFYQATTFSLISKLVRQINFSRINEAIFNKFGISIVTSKVSVFVQALAKDCITYVPTQTKLDYTKLFTRTRLGAHDIHSINSVIKNHLENYQFNPSITTFDAQHIVGGASYLASEQIKKYIKNGELVIVGSPTLFELDPTHHTKLFQSSFVKNE